MNKMVKTFSAVAIASALMLSCSDEGGDDSSSEIFTEVFAIKEITDNSFTYVEEEYYYCKSNGTLEKYEGTEEAEYSINGKNLTVKWNKLDDVEYNFNGTSSELVGTWTRNKNKAANCKYREYDDFWCDYNYDVTKAVFTQNSLSITFDVCWTDRVKDGYENRRGWTERAIDCNNAEIRKGNDVVKFNIKLGNNSGKLTYTYNGKSCERSWSGPSVSQQEKACKDAVEKAAAEGGYYDDYYWDSLYSDTYEKYEKCLKDNNFPEDAFGSNDDDYDSDEEM